MAVATRPAPRGGLAPIAPAGLTDEQARRALERFGPNAMPDSARLPLRRVLEKVWSPVPWMLEAAIVLELALGKYVEAAIIAALLAFNAALGVVQEGRAQATLAALRSRLAMSASVRRDWTRSRCATRTRPVAVAARAGDVVHRAPALRGSLPRAARAPAPREARPVPGPTRRDLVLTAAAMAAWPGERARGQDRAGTLRYVTGGVVDTLDPVMLGATPEATALGQATYDRLLRVARTPVGDGTYVFDFTRIEGELAERHEVSPDGLSITLRLRPDAAWHDGTPVTAEDVKWSLDRAVTAPTMSRAQLATGSLTSPEQMTVLGPHVVQVRLGRADRLAVPNLATPYAPMFNSRLARLHATADDPWATAWLKGNTAGGGAYTVQAFAPGTQVTLARNGAWRSGPLPAFRRVILQTVPEPATRAALMARGDADVATGLQAQDLRVLERSPAVRVVSTPMPTGFGALIFDTQMPPFDRVQVRRALALAVPYDAILLAALDGRGGRLYGAGWTLEPPTAAFPQPLPLHTDLDAARRTLAAAGMAGGFETTLSYSTSRSAFADPAAELIQESFGRIGVRVKIAELPDAQLAQAVTDKRLPMLLERSLALFPSTEYFFRIFASGPSRWNFSSWQNPAVDALLSRARFEPDDARYDAMAREMIGIMADQVPMATIWQPTCDVALAWGIAGYTTRCTYIPDFRDLSRG